MAWGVAAWLGLLGSAWAGELPRAAPEQVGMATARLERLDAVVERAIADGEVPGAVLLVTRDGRVVYEKAFGRRALRPRREEMTVDTIFDMASLTKVMATATSIMILAEEGKLSLSDPVALHLPEFAAFDKDSVTILQMLTHFSGLRPDIDLDEAWDGRGEALERGFAERLVEVPGERFVYSDINYFVLGELVERVSGRTLELFSRERIFEPLGMSDTGFLPAAEKASRIAPTQWRDGRMLRGEVHDPTAQRMGGVAGHAGLFSTAGDTARFALALINGGALGEARILSPLAAKKMTTNQSPPEQPDWRGVGFDIRTRFSSVRGDLFPVGSFGHTGFTGTSLWLDPDSRTAVILMTSRLHPDGGGDVAGLRKKVATVAAAAIVDFAEAATPAGEP